MSSKKWSTAQNFIGCCSWKVQHISSVSLAAQQGVKVEHSGEFSLQPHHESEISTVWTFTRQTHHNSVLLPDDGEMSQRTDAWPAEHLDGRAGINALTLMWLKRAVSWRRDHLNEVQLKCSLTLVEPKLSLNEVSRMHISFHEPSKSSIYPPHHHLSPFTHRDVDGWNVRRRVWGASGCYSSPYSHLCVTVTIRSLCCATGAEAWPHWLCPSSDLGCALERWHIFQFKAESSICHYHVA